MLVLLNVGKQSIGNRLVVVVVACITLSELGACIVRQVNNSPLNRDLVIPGGQFQDRDGVGGNRRAFGIANQHQSIHDKARELPRRVAEELLTAAVIDLTLHRLDSYRCSDKDPCFSDMGMVQIQ